MKKSEELQAQLLTLQENLKQMKEGIYDKYPLAQFYEAYAEFKAHGGVNLFIEEMNLKEKIAIEQRREVEVGDGVTVCFYTDREAYTVIKRTKRTITIQRDKATLSTDFKPVFEIGGFCAYCTNNNDQKYTYERDENGSIITCRWSEKNGCFMHGHCRIINGRREFYDYNF